MTAGGADLISCLSDTSDLTHFGPKTEVSRDTSVPGPKMSGHFGPTFLGPKCLGSEVSSYPYHYCSCWGDLFNKVEGSVISNRIGMMFNRTVLQVNTHRLTESIFAFTSQFQDDGHGVISHKKVLPPGN